MASQSRKESVGRTGPIIGKRNYRVISRVLRLRIRLALSPCFLPSSLALLLQGRTPSSRSHEKGSRAAKTPQAASAASHPARSALVLLAKPRGIGADRARFHTPSTKENPRRSGAAWCHAPYLLSHAKGIRKGSQCRGSLSPPPFYRLTLLVPHSGQYVPTSE